MPERTLSRRGGQERLDRASSRRRSTDDVDAAAEEVARADKQLQLPGSQGRNHPARCVSAARGREAACASRVASRSPPIAVQSSPRVPLLSVSLSPVSSLCLLSVSPCLGGYLIYSDGSE